METNRRGISGSTLKCIAVITMLIDHIAATVLMRLMSTGRISYDWYELYQMMRQIGRIAFPIYCFLLVEGFRYTRDKRKYALRLFLFALLSEIPFDLAFKSKALETSYQNVFFTLFVGLLTILLISEVEKRLEWNPWFKTILYAVIIVGGMTVAHLLRTDYSYYGVMCIVTLYLFRNNRIGQIVAGCLAFCWWEPAAVAAFVPIYFYNGTRGLKLKYVFYLFYPVHLLLLYLICVAFGVQGIPAV